MMSIVSHRHRFIYVKARKVASSSVLVALGRHCGEDDIVTSPGDTEGLPSQARNSAGLRTHMSPADLRQIVTAEQWRGYTKFACVRNPWDVAVSALLWRVHRRDKRRQDAFSEGFVARALAQQFDPGDPEYREHLLSAAEVAHRNESYYFAHDGTPELDIYMRYETLQADFDALCGRLGLPTAPLPRLKAQSRRAARDYRHFYDDGLRDAVAGLAPRTVAYFGYQF